MERGVRQGGVLSTFLYNIFIDELLQILTTTKCGTSINSLYTGNPAQADDLALLSTLSNALQLMIDSFYEYSRKWLYQLSPPKTKVMMFTGKSNQGPPSRHSWKMGSHSIEMVQTYKHVGIVLSADLTSMIRTDSAAKNMRSKFIATVGHGIRPSGMNPLTAYKILHKVVLPSVMFGCELWTSLTSKEYDKLEKSYRFCLKFALGTHMRTHTFMVHSLMGAGTIKEYIHQKQLSFLRRLIELPHDSVAYQVFLQRLMAYRLACTPQPRGFVSHVYKMIHTYDLTQFMENYISDAEFPSKKPWSVISRNSVENHNIITMDSYLSNQCKTISLFIHRGKGLPSNLLNALKFHPEIKREIMFMVKLAAHPTVTERPKCPVCSDDYESLALHYLCTCVHTQERREAFWEIVTNLFDIRLAALLNNISDEYFTSILLGGIMPEFTEIFQDSAQYFFFIKCAARIYYDRKYTFHIQYT